jgi:hypothetical protein
MNRVEIWRTVENRDGTFGILCVNGERFGVTLELPWKDNKMDVSCIPAGKYRAELIDSEHHGKAYCLRKVPNRTDILMHWGNWRDDTLGCILIGEKRETVYSDKYPKGKPGISNSRVTYGKMMKALGWEPWVEVVIHQLEEWAKNKVNNGLQAAV